VRRSTTGRKNKKKNKKKKKIKQEQDHNIRKPEHKESGGKNKYNTNFTGHHSFSTTMWQQTRNIPKQTSKNENL
jgi:hypothetical protein